MDARPLSTPGRVALSLVGVVKQYDRVQALRGADLEVRSGELLTILGPSGSGKTTLLKCVAGFEIPEAGTVELGGRDITELAPNRRDIGMVFQNYALFPHMSVTANVGFALRVRRVPRTQIRQRVQAILALVGLEEMGDRLPRQLSGGQQQRVALARALVFNPGLLLLDEPFGALDRKLREQMQLEVRRLQQRLGITTIFVTHDQEEALVISDRIAVMDLGVIEQLGGPRDVYARPVNRFVADFIGESNLLHARVTVAGDAAVLDSGATIALPEIRKPGEEVGLLIRPERLELRPPAPGEDASFAGEVAEVVYLGNTLKYTVRLDLGSTLLVRRPFGQPPVFDVGQRVQARWSADDVHAVRW
ncbi:MAG: ABC transporter ATP-binding protein [Candidatus Rokubacteria bacterium]|nr:ABC transporter ATP-binding protein [Candidatus Rokubacteria bacterium]